MTRATPCFANDVGRGRRQSGFTLIELLVVVIIIGILAAIAIPVYLGEQNKAREAILMYNAHRVAVDVKTYVLEAYDTAYHASSLPTSGDKDVYLSNHLVAELQTVTGKNREGYVNPFTKSAGATAIVHYGTITSGVTSNYMPPAVFVTNAAACKYTSFDTSASATDKTNLTGAVVVYFNNPATTSGTIDVYYVDGRGRASALMIQCSIEK